MLNPIAAKPRPIVKARWAVLIVAGLALAGCSSLERHQPLAAASQPDDDAYCRQNGGVQGSDAYVACRKDRDVRGSRSDDKLERQHRNLAERMLNGQ